MALESRLYPKVYRIFERQIDERAVKFQVEDIPEGMWSSAVEFMLGNYVKEDVWCVAAGTANDPIAVEEYRMLLTALAKQKSSLVCFLIEGDGTGRTLVGVNIAVLNRREKLIDHIPPKSKAGLKSLKMFSEAMKVTTLYDLYDVKEYLMGVGLYVTPGYRKLGIATEMLKVRLNLARDLGVKVSAGIFTSERSQKAAQRAGMECYYRTSFKEFGTKCDIKFHTDTKYLKMYAVRVD